MKRLLACLFFVCILSMEGHAQILPGTTPAADSAAFAKVRARMDSIRQYRPTVALVLGGGGARGAAHLGVIRYMEELGIPVDIVTGTSMGALLGGFYAMGYRHKTLDSLVRAVNWPLMMSDDIPNSYLSYKQRKYRDDYLLRIPFQSDGKDLEKRLERRRMLETMPDGVLYGLNVRNLLSSVSVGYQDSLSFADLPIPFACVATDFYSMAPKYWTSGHIIDALHSTMAIPFYFRALRKGGEILVDGGMRNNLPADIAREMGADIIIGSEMVIRRERNQLNSPVDFVMQSIIMLSSSVMEKVVGLLDLHVHHELKGYTMLSFDTRSVADIIDQGYANAVEQKALFEAIATVVAGKKTPPVAQHAPARNLARQGVRVDEVRFTGIREEEKDYLLRPRDYPADGIYDQAVIERLLNKIYGTNAFEAVTYRLEGHEEPFTLVFDCRKGQASDLALSLRADTDEALAASVHLGLGTRRLTGPSMTADLKLGTNPALALGGRYTPRLGLPAVGLTARARLVNVSHGLAREIDDRMLHTATDLFVEDSRLRLGSMRAGVSAEMIPFKRHLSQEEFWSVGDGRSYWLSAFGNFRLDTFDDGYFPTKGVRLFLDGRYVFKGRRQVRSASDAIREEAVSPYLSALAGFQGAFSFGRSFTLLPQLNLGWTSTDPESVNPMHRVALGGFLANRYTERQVPFFAFSHGYRNCMACVAMALLDLRYRFLGKNYAFLRAGLATEDEQWAGLLHQVPMYALGAEYARQTIVGPFRLAGQWNNRFGFTFYASIGFDL